MIEKNRPQFFTKREDAPHDARIIDTYKEACQELYRVQHPGKKEVNDAFACHDIWIYYPWKNTLVHTVDNTTYQTLRTARNKHIITKEEQAAYRAMTVGIIGMSIGSASLASLVISGGPRELRIADHDLVEITNLNRMQATLLDVGMNKAIVAAQRAYELDPFAVIDPWTMRVTEENLLEFLTRTPALQICVDAMDELEMKVRLRLACKEKSIPVIMATSNGDGVLLDVERFDLDPTAPLFHGRVPELAHPNPELLRGLSAKENFPQWFELAKKIVDISRAPKSMLRSLPEIGKTIAGVPQLGTTVNIAGAAIAYIIRKIASGAPMPSARYAIDLETLLTL